MNGISENQDRIYDDMVEMSVLNQIEILNNLRRRYSQDIIFTLIGPTLIVINPYKPIQGIFEEKVMTIIAEKMKIKQQLISQGQYKEYPHIYSISASAYENLFKNNINQSIVISGESGAGKTENAKYAMRYLTQLSSQKHSAAVQQLSDISSKKQNIVRSREASVSSKSIEQQILFCNPIMEAFGNAKTARNNNSSRFVECSSQTILGAQIQKYLLEKSRVTHIANNERNYHIFYHLLSNKQLTNQIGISSNPKDYYYLNQSDVYDVDSINDSELFEEVQNSFESMGFYYEKIFTIWQILASILLIGNLQFDQAEENKAVIKNKNILNQISKLLQCEEEVIGQALTVKVLETGKQLIKVPLNEVECIAVKNSLSKVLYDRLFTWLVQQLNSAINPPALKSMKSLSIGLLDIFGFENFQNNSFEQMCINYTNERLQKLYISYVFVNEEKILKEDGLAEHLKHLTYADNQGVVDLIDSSQGILQLLNDQCKSKGNDKKFLESLKSLTTKFDKIAFPKIQKETFIIKHTASDVKNTQFNSQFNFIKVEYAAEDFCDKNKDEVNKQIENCIRQSKNQVIVSIFSIDGQQIENTSAVQKDKFLGEKFRNQMNDLMGVLSSCQVHFVRCIKPNETKEKDNFIEAFVSLQIQYLGVLESIEVRKQMYPFRKTYQQFFDLYYIIDETIGKQIKSQQMQQNIQKGDYKSLVEQLIQRNFPKYNQKVCLFGNSKIYLKQESERELETKKFQVLQQLKIEAQLKIFQLSNQTYIQLKKAFVKKLQNISRQFSLIYKLRNIQIKQNLKILTAQKRALAKWSSVSQKIREVEEQKRILREKKRHQEEMEQKRQQEELQKQKKIREEQEKKRIEEEYKKQKEKEEEEENKQMQDEEQDEYDDDYDKRMNKYNVSDSKSNMHLINQSDQDEIDEGISSFQGSDTKRNLFSQPNNSIIQAGNNNINPQSYSQDQSYQSVALDQSYASVTGIRQQELDDKKKVEALIQKENRNNKQQDYQLSQYTSIAKYYMNKKDIQIPPPNQDEIESPPVILDILDKQESRSEGSCQLDILNTEFNESDVDEGIINEFRRFKLDDFLREKLKKRTKNLFQRKTVKEIMVVTKKDLSSGLTKLTKEEDKKAVEVFKDILQLMDKKDEAGNQEADVIIYSIIKRCKNTSLSLKDEVFLQMLKQINNNNNNKIEITRVLQLMVAFSYTYKPSLEVIQASLQFLDALYKEFKKQRLDEFLSKLFQYLINKLIQDRKRQQVEKEYPLSMPQVKKIINLKQIIFPLYLPNGSQYSMCIDPSQKVNDIKIKALSLLDIPSRIPAELFGIYDIKNIPGEYEEKLLQETDASWDLISELDYKCREEGKQPNSFFLMKIKYCYSFSPSDSVSISYFHAQSFLDIRSGKITLKKEDRVKVACINMIIQNDYYSQFNIEEVYQMTEQMSEQEKKEIAVEIRDAYSKIAPTLKNKPLAKLEYISILSNYDEYMGWQIQNVLIQIENDRRQVSLNLNPNQIMFINKEQSLKNNLLIIPADIISNQYIEKENHLILEIDQKQKTIKDEKIPHMIVIQTPHALKISQYFSNYIDLLKMFNNYKSQSRSSSMNVNQDQFM